MAVTNRYAIREVAEASFFDVETGALKAKLDTLKMSNIENTAETVYATGGRGNPKLVGFSGDRAARIVLQDALITNEIVGMLTGNDVTTGASVVVYNESLSVASNAVTLTHTPSATGALVSVNKLNADGTLGDLLTYTASTPSASTYSITGQTVSFGSGAIPAGNKVLIYYNTAGSVDSKTIKVTTDKFAGSYKLILDVLVRDAFTKKDFAAQITVPSAKLEDSFTLQMQPDGDPTVLDIPLEALKPSGSKDLYTMVIYDEDDLT